MKKKSMDWYKQQQRFSVRKYHFGAASVLLGTALVFGGAQASADEVTAPATPSTESTTATSAETTTASEGAPAVLTASEATPASLTASEASSSTEATSLDKGALQLALSQAKALDLSNKTSETVAILLAQIEHAQTVLNTASSQEELNQAVTDLQAAQAQLADKPAQPVAVSPASVATTPAPATSTTSSTPEATTPASVTASSTSSTPEATTSVSPATASTESSSSPTVSTRSRRTRRDTSASTHTPVEVNSTSTGRITVTPIQAGTLYEDWSVTTKLLGSASEGDYVEYTYKGIPEYTLPSFPVKFNGVDIGSVSYVVTNDPFSDWQSTDKNKRDNVKPGGSEGKIRVTFNKNIENLTNVEYTINVDHLDYGVAGSNVPWPLESTLSDKNGVIFSTTTTIPAGWVNPLSNYSNTNEAARALLGDDKVFRTGLRHVVANPENAVLHSGDLLTYNLDPSSVARFDLSDSRLQPGYTNTTIDSNGSSVNGNGAIVSSGATLKYQLVDATDLKVTYKVLEVGNGAALFRFESPLVVTDLTGVDYTNKVVKPVKVVSETISSSGALISSQNQDLEMPLSGTSTDFSGAVIPRANVYVQYVDESGTPIPGTTKTTLLNNEVTGTPYTASGLDLVAFPNYTFVKMQDGSAPATGNSTTTDLTVTYVYHYNTEAERFTPNGQDLTVKHNDTPSAEDGIANKTDLPTGTTYAWKGTAPDTSTPGTKPATITVSYPDGSSEDVNVNVNVTPRADDYTPVGKDVPAKHGDTPSAASGIANKGDLPADATYTWKGTAPDTTTPGDKPATVVVTYDDGTVDEVPVTVKVQPQADDYDPQAQPVSVDHGATPNAEDGIANKGTLPPGTTYDWKTPIDTSTPGTKPGTVVVTYPDGTKDEVPVPVTVGEEAALYTPVGQDVPAKHGENPAASQGIANRGTLPAGTTYDWKSPVDTTTPGDKPATVVVTYPDGSKDEVPVTVKVKPQSDEFTPNGQDVPTKHGETPNAADGIANKGDLPAGTTYDWKTPVDTTTPGDKPGTVVVTYPDGTKDEVPVTVKVKPQSDEFTPTGQDVPAKHGETPNAADGIANKGDLPAGTTYDWKTPVDTTTPGDKPGTVVVTYPDGTKDEVPVTVKVKPQSDEFTPNGQDVPTKHGETPNAADGIANKGDLPAGTTYDWKTPVDTSTPGDKPGTVVVTYPDGTKDEVPVTVKVKPQSDEFTPTGQDVPAKHGETPNAADGIANKGDLPAGTTYDWKTPVDTTTPGDKPGTVVVTYPDGTKDEVPVTVKVKPQSDEFTPTGQDVPAKHGETPNAADGIANKGDLPAGTTYDWKTPVDTTTPGDKPGTVVVTYPDGTKDEVPVTVKVKPQSDEFTPVGKDVPAKHGDTPNAADGISNKGDLPAGTTYDWKTPVDTSTPGDKPGTVVVTYPDGTKDEVPVTVKVQPQTDDYDPQAKPVAVDHGATPNAEDGIANKGDLPAGTTYDWKTPVDTSTPGTKPGTVVVTYPDGTKDEVPVPVTVGEQAALYTPVGQDVPAKHGETPAASQGIANRGTLPAGTTYDWKTPVDTSTPGDKPATVVVTYPDGTKDEVPVTVKVKPQSDEFTPAGQDVPTKHGETPNAADGIANKGDLPADTKYDWKTPVDTSTPGDKPGTVVVTYPDGTKDEVPVTVKVKPQSDEFTPAGQDVPAKHGETPKAEDGIANKGDLPDGTKFDWKTPVDTTTPGDKSGTVVVTYPDGTKDEVPVTVKVKPQSDEFTPVGKDVPAKHGETPKAEDGIANKGDLPDGTKYDWKTPVDTTTPGDKPGTVVVTYPDGTKDEIPVTVKVKPQSDEFTPQPKDVSTDHGKTPKAEDGIANKGDLPAGTTYDWKAPVDTTTPGDKPGTVVVTYPDGTKDEVPVTVHVGSQSDLYNPDGQNLNVKQGDQPEASKGIANRGNLPDGTTYDWKTPVDTSTVGDKPATVVVTYPDGSKDEVPVTVKVTEKLHVKTPADKVPVKDPSNLTPDDINKVVENIKKENPGLPDDAKITVNPNGGDTTIETKDGDKVTIPGTDLVRPETDADKNNVKVPADKVPVKDPSNLTDAEKDKVKDNIKKANPDLPNGTKIDVAKDGTATITFPDGSTKVIPGSDLVRPETDADRHTPKGQDVPVKQGETPKAEDGIANKGDLPNGTKIEWKETPDTSKVGDHNATIVITYPDGSKDEVTVTVKVSPNANNNGHNGNNGSQGNGNSGSHNNGTNGDQGQGDKDKKDQAGKDTNNGLDKLFSNSGNGSASGNQSGASRKQAPALPNTGDASNPAMALAFAALLGGTALAMKKRKKEEEE